MEALKIQGWHLNDEFYKEKHDIKTLERNALNTDLSLIGNEYIQHLLADDITEKCILQISKIKNIAVPSKKEDSFSSGARMLRLNLTDGHQTCISIEISPIKDLTTNTCPGMKVQLFGKVDVINGVLLLSSSNCKILGGHVEVLYSKWKIAKQLKDYNRNDVKAIDAPPPFVPFGQKLMHTVEIKRKVIIDSTPASNSTEDIEFNKNRSAAIKELKEQDMAMSKQFHNKPKANFQNTRVGQPHSHRNQQAKEYQMESSNMSKNDDSRFCRDLSSSTNVKADEYFLSELVNMGFKKFEVAEALRKSNNSFDAALDSLTIGAPSDGRQNIKSDNENNFARNDGKFKRGGRGKYNKDNDDIGTNESSAPATLFDFLENKMGKLDVKDQKKEFKQSKYQHDRPTTYGSAGPSSSYNAYERKENNSYQRNTSRNGNQNYNHTNDNQLSKSDYSKRNKEPYKNNDRQYTGNKDKRHSNNRLRNDSQKNSSAVSNQPNNRQRNDYQKNAPVSTNQSSNNRPKNNYQNKSQGFTNKTSNIGQRNDFLSQKKSQDITNQSKSRNTHVATENKNVDPKPIESETGLTSKGPPYKSPTTFKSVEPIQQENQKNTIPQEKFSHITHRDLKLGMNCLAKYWEDNKFYPAVVTDLHPQAPTAVVFFTAYGNYEEVSFKDIMIDQMWNNDQSTLNNPTFNNRNKINKTRQMQSIYVPPAQR